MRSVTLAEIQSGACNKTLVAFTLVGVLALLFSLGRSLTFGWDWVMNVHIGMFMGLLGVTLARHHLGLALRAGFLSGLLFAIGLVSIVRYGVGSGALIFFVAGCIFAGCFFPLRVTFSVMGLGCVCILLIFTARKMGWIPESYNPRIYMQDTFTWLQACVALIVSASGPIFALTAVSRALDAERQRADEAANARSQFLARMSHELRAPMTTVIGMAELLEGTRLAPNQSTMTTRLLRAARGLLGLLNDVLDFSKVDAGRLVIESVPFRMSNLIAETCDMFAAAATARGLRITTHLPGKFSDAVLGDRFRLGQVLSNLLGNALKFTERGTVTITVSQAPADNAMVSTTFAITDTGIGIAPEQLAQLFQPFVQADSSTTRKYGGSGLGLVISQSLVQAMGGKISVTSTPGQGSTFSFTLLFSPAVVDDVSALPAPQPGTAAASGPTIAPNRTAPLLSLPAGLRVLLADDDPMVHTLIDAVLDDGPADAKPQILGVQNGAEAVDATRTHVFDLILIDMHMPVMNGITATRQIRSHDSTRNVPIIALTADIISDGKQAVLTAGANAVVSKPIVWAQLQAEINTVLSQRPA
ncbi:MAG: response regulator [Rhodospirillaceae bacterium]|nr:response regulator [Rhodospirillaceae bacterium]